MQPDRLAKTCARLQARLAHGNAPPPDEASLGKVVDQMRELLQQLDSQRFWQIHRGTIVRCDAIDTAERDEAGKLTLTLRGNPARLVVSRVYADLFKRM